MRELTKRATSGVIFGVVLVAFGVVSLFDALQALGELAKLVEREQHLSEVKSD